MKYHVDFGELSVDVLAESSFEALEKAFIEADPIILEQYISFQCENKEKEYVSTKEFLDKFENDNKPFSKLVESKNIDELIYQMNHGFKGASTYFAAKALAKIGTITIPKLVKSMEDCASTARMATMQQLYREWRDNADPGDIMIYKDKEPKTGVPVEFIMFKESIGNIGSEVDREIQRRFKRGVPNPCKPAALALVFIGAPSVPSLIECLKEKDWLVKLEAAWALGCIRDKQAIPYLRKLIRLPGFDLLSKAARNAIRNIQKTQ